jgi:hypothetical protein
MNSLSRFSGDMGSERYENGVDGTPATPADIKGSPVGTVVGIAMLKGGQSV